MESLVLVSPTKTCSNPLEPRTLWMNEWMNEWMNKWINEWVNELFNGWENELMKDKMNK